MKNIIIKISLFFAVLLFTINCNSQIVINREGALGNLPQNYISTGQYYYKDVNNYLDNFVGTWSYINGNEEFQIILTKVIKFHKIETSLDLNYYEDGIVLVYKKFVNNILTFTSPSYLDPNFDTSDGALLEGYIFDYGRLTKTLYMPLSSEVFKQGGEPIAPYCDITLQPFLRNHPARILFKLNLTGTINYDRATYTGQPTYSIPNEVIMIKI